MSNNGRNGFNLPGKGSRYQLQKLNDTHLNIIRLLIQGYDDKEIAELLDVTTATVRYTKESPLVQEKLDIMRSVLDAECVETAKMIQQLQPLAIMKLAEILAKSKDEKEIRLVAQDLLNRGGHAPQKGPDTHLHAHVTLEDLKEIKERARKRNERNGELVEDAEIVE